jgi:hypothetical protein
VIELSKDEERNYAIIYLIKLSMKRDLKKVCWYNKYKKRVGEAMKIIGKVDRKCKKKVKEKYVEDDNDPEVEI